MFLVLIGPLPGTHNKPWFCANFIVIWGMKVYSLACFSSCVPGTNWSCHCFDHLWSAMKGANAVLWLTYVRCILMLYDVFLHKQFRLETSKPVVMKGILELIVGWFFFKIKHAKWMTCHFKLLLKCNISPIMSFVGHTAQKKKKWQFIYSMHVQHTTFNQWGERKVISTQCHGWPIRCHTLFTHLDS